MTTDQYITIAIQIIVALCVVFNTGTGRSDKHIEKSDKQREEDRRVMDERHKDNKDLIHGLSNSVHSILLTITAFDTWKKGHELRCDEHYDELVRKLDRSENHYDELKHTLDRVLTAQLENGQ